MSAKNTHQSSIEGAARRAFTLIELLVVISIIALLIGITIPSLGVARESARRSKCLSNLKSIGISFQLYLNDYDDVFPHVSPLQGTPGGGNDPAMFDVLEAYIDAPIPYKRNPTDTVYVVSDVFACPSDRQSDDAAANYEPVHRTFGTSYFFLPGALMDFAEMSFIGRPSYAVSKAYANLRTAWPVVYDYGEWHDRASGPKQNAVYYPDWHADWNREISSLELEEFFDDVRSNGGPP